MRKQKMFKLFSIFICMIFLTAMFVPAMKVTAYTNVIADGLYYIKNPYSGKYLDVRGAWTNNNSPLLQYGFTAKPNQQWRVVYQNDGTGTYKIYPMHTPGMVMDVNPSNYFDDYGICIWSDAGYMSSRFAIQVAPNTNNKYHNILTKHSNFTQCVDIRGGLSGEYINEWPLNNTTNQQWLFEPCVSKLSSYNTFSAFDVSDSSQDEAGLVNSWMRSFGYIDVGTFNNAHGDVIANTIQGIGQYSDIIYINGHGDRYASLSIHTQAGAVNEILSVELPMQKYWFPNAAQNTKIGAYFLSGSTTKTNSVWNKKTKWAILAQCSQLNYGTSSNIPGNMGNHWNGLNNAQIWARTMLGNGKRMHGILGYYGSAPNGPTHYERLNSFFEAAEPNDNIPLIHSWKFAHEKLFSSSTWGALYHSANALDRFSAFTTTTASGSNYSIYLVTLERFGSAIPLNSRSGLSESISEDFYRFSININDTILTAQKQQYISERLSNGEKTSLKFLDNGVIKYYNYNLDYGQENISMNKSDLEIINLAKDELRKLGLLPQNGYREAVYKTVRQKLNLNNSKSTPEIIEYTVNFYKQINGFDLLSTEDDGIQVSINKNGLSRLEYNWRDISFTSERKIIGIDRKTANQILINNYDKLYKNIDLKDDAKLSQAYYLDKNEIKPIWVFSEDESCYINPVFINAINGDAFS